MLSSCERCRAPRLSEMMDVTKSFVPISYWSFCSPLRGICGREVFKFIYNKKLSVAPQLQQQFGFPSPRLVILTPNF